MHFTSNLEKVSSGMLSNNQACVDHLSRPITEDSSRQWRRSRVFIFNFEHISQLVLVFLLLTLSR